MTYNERKTHVCQQCGRAATCGYVTRNLTAKCDYLQAVMQGWELGRQDAQLQTADLWMARDLDGTLWIFNGKPVRQGDEFRSTTPPNMGGQEIMMDSRLFPTLTWKNSPKELIIKED